MFEAKEQNKNKILTKLRQLHKSSVLLVVLVIILGATVGSSIAYLATQTEPIINKFIPTEITAEINETFNGIVKTDVKVKNNGDIAAYVRATYVATWQDAQGNIAPLAPVAGEDYTITLNTESDWFAGTDGYYYCKTAVAAASESPVFIKECKPVDGKAPEGYILSVEILASAIQSVPAEAVAEAWKVVQVDSNGNLVAVTGG